MADKATTPVILLAGGKSSRMGQPKGLVRHRGHLWLEHQLSALQNAGLPDAVLVLGYGHESYFAALPDLGERLRCVLNPEPERGPFSSIQAGGREAIELWPDARSFWILPIDVPCAAPETWKQLSASNKTVTVPTYQERGGHPVKLSREFLQELIKLPADQPDSRLDRQIRRLGPTQVARVEVADPAILKNLNTPTDWA